MLEITNSNRENLFIHHITTQGKEKMNVLFALIVDLSIYTHISIGT